MSLIPKCLLSSLTTKRAEPASGNGPQNFEPLGGFLVNIILGFSWPVRAMNGKDFPSFSNELYLGWFDLISSLSRTRASVGFWVTMKSIFSDSCRRRGIISRSGFFAK